MHLSDSIGTTWKQSRGQRLFKGYYITGGRHRFFDHSHKEEVEVESGWGVAGIQKVFFQFQSDF